MNVDRLQHVQSLDAWTADFLIPLFDLLKELSIALYLSEIDLTKPCLKAVMIQAQLKVSLYLLIIRKASAHRCLSLRI